LAATLGPTIAVVVAIAAVCIMMTMMVAVVVAIVVVCIMMIMI